VGGARRRTLQTFVPVPHRRFFALTGCNRKAESATRIDMTFGGWQ
jgi:hypothetical protein